MIKAADINTMQRGDIAVIVAVDRAQRDPAGAQRLHEMGFDEGVDIELLHRAPLGGDPLAVRVGNMTVALRKTLAALVEVGPQADLVRDKHDITLA
jgi:ferrous iron transport protein A